MSEPTTEFSQPGKKQYPAGKEVARGDAQFEQPILRMQGPNGSYYQHPHSGEAVPSVTTISGLIDKSGHLTPWAAKLAAWWAADNFDLLQLCRDPDEIADLIIGGSQRRRDEAKELGSLAHNTIDGILDGKGGPIPDAVTHHIKGWTEWVSRYVDSFILTEATVWSHRYLYAGTLDALVKFKDGSTRLVDYKTGSQVHTDAALQLVALSKADCVVTTDGESPLPRIDGFGVLHLPAPAFTPTGRVSTKGKWSYRDINITEQEWTTFLCLRQVYDWEKKHSKKVLGGKQTQPEWTQQ